MIPIRIDRWADSLKRPTIALNRSFPGINSQLSAVPALILHKEIQCRPIRQSRVTAQKHTATLFLFNQVSYHEGNGRIQIIQFFSSVLADEIQKAFGHECQYAIGNFSGSQDRKFADFFAGTDSVNILIEFKEFKNEHRDEFDKPLRERLCKTLTVEIAELSRSCHFIGWGLPRSTISIELNTYIDLACQLWGGSKFLKSPSDYLHASFINGFIKGTVGVNYEDFIRYIEHLNTTAGGSASGDQAAFRSILFSRDNSGQLLASRFDNLGELKTLSGLRPGPSSGQDWSGP